jgi:hypothetical protein
MSQLLDREVLVDEGLEVTLAELELGSLFLRPFGRRRAPDFMYARE